MGNDSVISFGRCASRAGSGVRACQSKIDPGEELSPDWALPSCLESNPLTWLVSVNGVLVDVRQMSRGTNEEACRRDPIPSLPEGAPK